MGVIHFAQRIPLIYLKVAVLFFTFFCFLLGSFPYIDPDFGWHVRTGQVILSSGIPRHDPFSYSMPSYPFVDHEWLVSVSFALLLPLIGMTGLNLLFCSVALSPFILLSFWIHRKRYMFLLLVIGSACVTYIGIRSQILAWVYLMLLFSLVYKERLWNRYKFFVPFLFLLWANTHESFVGGIVILFLFVLLRNYPKSKMPIFGDVLVFILTFAATCINPYGSRIYYDAFVTFSDPALRWEIVEWFPFIFRPNAPGLFFIVISCMALVIVLRQLSATNLAIYVVLLILGLSGTRQMPFWYFFALPITVYAFELFDKTIQTVNYAQARLSKAFFFLTVLSALFVLANTWLLVDAILPQNSSVSDLPSQRALNYLQTHATNNNIFSTYGWGGYLDWKLPEKKVFIDGRMQSWRWQVSNPYESDYAYRDYNDILSGDLPLAKTERKYHIDTLLLPLVYAKDPGRGANLFDTKKIKIVDEAKKDGFKLVFKDSSTIIYRKLSKPIPIDEK